MKNKDIRKLVESTEINYWQIADVLGVPDSILRSMLREELSRDEANRIFAIIKYLEKAKNLN